jgi:hypothetical protein
MGCNIGLAEMDRRSRLYEIGLKECSNQACRLPGPLPLRAFAPREDGWMGLYARCTDCRNRATLDYQKRNPEKLATRVRAWQQQHPDRAHLTAKRYRFRRARNGALKPRVSA